MKTLKQGSLLLLVLYVILALFGMALPKWMTVPDDEPDPARAAA